MKPIDTTDRAQEKEAATDYGTLFSLVFAFNRLNDTGKEEAIKRIKEMAYMPQYTGEVKPAEVLEFKKRNRTTKGYAGKLLGGLR